MAPSSVHLPNGQNLTVKSIFGGLGFVSNDLNSQRSAFPPGWTVMLNEEDDAEDAEGADPGSSEWDFDNPYAQRKEHIHRYKKPTLKNDHMYLATISNPSSAEFKPASSPTRQIAMMLWATLWWYFHQPEPEPRINSKKSAKTPEAGRPKAEWRININREGIFKGRQLMNKLERMGLIMSEDSSIGVHGYDRSRASSPTMFVTRRAFWQIDARIFLFTLSPAAHSPLPGSTPISSRPASPSRASSAADHRGSLLPGALTPKPFQSSSHLPTYYPPHPTQYTFTNGIRHPIRPKPWGQGEMFYCRYIPSVGQYLSFRVASLAPAGCSRSGPWTEQPRGSGEMSPRSSMQSVPESIMLAMTGLTVPSDNDVDLLHRWMNDPRVAYSWGEDGPREHQEEFLKKGLESRHSFPVIGCWDGKPFGYFEIYWVKEDILGKYMAGAVGDSDRGIHCLVGEQEFRGPHRVHIWMSALIHYCWMADMRTDVVMLEPRVDNTK